MAVWSGSAVAEPGGDGLELLEEPLAEEPLEELLAELLEEEAAPVLFFCFFGSLRTSEIHSRPWISVVSGSHERMHRSAQRSLPLKLECICASGVVLLMGRTEMISPVASHAIIAKRRT